MKNILLAIFNFFYTKDKSPLDVLTEDEYITIFIKGRKKEEIETSYQKAWEAKNFEIDNYWKRANYFWAFQVASFAGYFSILSSKAYSTNPQVLYFVVCIGLITSLAWVFINQGSKTWQRHWEIHVDMLENEITGPLYKIITNPKTFSVSKINEIVSRFIFVVWIILGVKYFSEHITLVFDESTKIDYQVWLSSVSALYFGGAMVFGYGRGRAGNRRVKFYRRKYSTLN